MGLAESGALAGFQARCAERWGLWKREAEVLWLGLYGVTSREDQAARMFVEVNTIHVYRHRLFRKMGVRCLGEALALAKEEAR